MLLSSMDHLNYYAMPKESYLEVDTSGVHGGDGYGLGPQDDLQVQYLPGGNNEENSPKNGTKSSLYKTELCKRFSEFGNCRYGGELVFPKCVCDSTSVQNDLLYLSVCHYSTAKCQFAHGIAELRHVVRHPKYKTTKCKSYWGSGHCPYGSRCRFIHEETEAYAQSQYGASGLGLGGGSTSGGGLFKDHLGGGMGSLMMAPPSNDLSLAGSYGGVLYGEPERFAPPPAAYGAAKDYSLFDKTNTWAPARSPVQAGNYEPRHFGSLKPASHHVAPPAGAIGSTPLPPPSVASASAPISVPGAAPPGYPDLQDAIDALMKFSLTSDAPAEGEPLKSPTLADAKLAKATGTEFALESDELWKDFPSSTSGSAPASTSTVAPALSDKLEPGHWSSGLSLSLESNNSPFELGTTATTTTTTSKSADEAKPAAASSAATSTSGTASGSSSNNEESPRLSVFERFH